MSVPTAVARPPLTSVIDLSTDDNEDGEAVGQLDDAQLARALQQREYELEYKDNNTRQQQQQQLQQGSNKRRRTQPADDSHSQRAGAANAGHQSQYDSDSTASRLAPLLPPSTSGSESVGSFSSGNSSSSSGGGSVPSARSHVDSPSSDCAFHMNHIRGVSNAHSLRLRSVVIGSIERCVALNYCWDLAWLMDECPVLQTVARVDCVAGEKYRYADRSSEELRQQANELRLPNVHIHFARLPLPYSCHHTKLLLLFYADGLRFIHTTANFLSCDAHYKNQSMFVQDFPVKQRPQQQWDSEWWLHDDFERALCDYFQSYAAIGLDLLSALRQFDYRAARCILIPSAPGTYTGQTMSRWGHMKVRAVLQRELTHSADLAAQPITAQFSSLGSCSTKWMSELRHSLGASGGSLQSSPPPIRLVWPTLTDVRDSVEGWMAGGSICCDKRNLNDTVRPLLHRWDGSLSGRHQAAPHIKSYCRANGQRAAYVIVTSANMSAAAWGTLQKNDTQLAVRHYEIGLLFTSVGAATPLPSAAVTAIILVHAKRSTHASLRHTACGQSGGAVAATLHACPSSEQRGAVHIHRSRLRAARAVSSAVQRVVCSLRRLRRAVALGRGSAHTRQTWSDVRGGRQQTVTDRADRGQQAAAVERHSDSAMCGQSIRAAAIEEHQRGRAVNNSGAVNNNNSNR